jgi:hypothetical protein
MTYQTGTLISELKASLTEQRYHPVAIDNYCRNADYFLRHLSERGIALEAVTSEDVSSYLRLAVRRFRKRHGRAPARDWISIPRSGIHALLRRALKSFPPEPPIVDAGDRFRRNVLAHYEAWLREERGLRCGPGTHGHRAMHR